jgi:hypothetical protein
MMMSDDCMVLSLIKSLIKRTSIKRTLPKRSSIIRRRTYILVGRPKIVISTKRRQEMDCFVHYQTSKSQISYLFDFQISSIQI